MKKIASCLVFMFFTLFVGHVNAQVPSEKIKASSFIESLGSNTFVFHLKSKNQTVYMTFGKVHLRNTYVKLLSRDGLSENWATVRDCAGDVCTYRLSSLAKDNGFEVYNNKWCPLTEHHEPTGECYKLEKINGLDAFDKAVAKFEENRKKDLAARENLKAKQSKEDQSDSFQQVMNYIVTGDPLNRDNGVYKAKIFDQKNCIAGYVDNNGGYTKIYWNNIDIKSIKIGKQFRDNVWLTYILLTGSPYIIDFQPKNMLLALSLFAKGMKEGKSSYVELPIGDPKKYDTERLRKALSLLYKDHCSGSKSKTAF